MKKTFTLLLILVNLFLISNAGIIYVNRQATGDNDGSSWNSAFTDLQDALEVFQKGDEIWVAEGIYKPTKIIDINEDGILEPREATFCITDSILLYGGFKGNETSVSQRNRNIHATILSGDIDNNDQDPDTNGIVDKTEDIVGENAFHVLFINTMDSGAVIDGFIINAGLANSAGANVPYPQYSIEPNLCGAGVLYRPVDWEQKNYVPQFRNCTFIANKAELFGGALYIESIRMQFGNVMIYLDSCVFTRNLSENSGGAFYMGTTRPESRFFSFIKNCNFNENESREKGGAMMLISDFSSIDSCSFVLNKALAGSENKNKFSGSGGAVFLEMSNSVFSNCVFDKNAATGSDLKSYAGGGAIYNYLNSDHWAIKWGAHPVFKNCYFQMNATGGNDFAYGGAIVNYCEDAGLDTRFVNCQFFRNGSQYNGGAVSNIENSSITGMKTFYTNCSFISNIAGSRGGALYNQGSSFLKDENIQILLENSILWDNSAMLGEYEEINSLNFLDDIESSCPEVNQINNCLIKGCGGATWKQGFGTDGGYNLDENPIFNFVTSDRGLVMALLTSASPAINAGNNNAILLQGVDKDLQGNARTYSQHVDMGAFEYQGIVTKVNPQLAGAGNVMVYPVPAKDYIEVSSTLSEIGSVEIYNLKGQLMFQKAISGATKRIGLEGINSGLHFIKVKSKDGTELEKRSFVIQ